ncbi:sun protein [Candidatus Magnetoovum chiemensis]|nr:sun protein [Candidatus Magnetoovum chiemensis]
MDKVRLSALEALELIIEKDVKPKDALEEKFYSRFERKDRAFLMELVYGVVRFKITIDWLLSFFLSKPSKLPIRTYNNLRLGVYQIEYMRVPHWAAVDEAVKIEKKKKGAGAGAGAGAVSNPSLVNAVLRNFIRKEGEIMLPPFNENPVEHISITASHPAWMIERWIKRFASCDEALDLARANNVPGAITLRVNTLAASRNDICAVLDSLNVEHELTKRSPYGIRIIRNVDITYILEHLKGKVLVQDEASQLVSILLDPKKGERILDACAAPGGKSTHIAELTEDGASIIAVDANARKMKLLTQNVNNLNLKSISPVVADVLNVSFDEPFFDKILLDAPCSSTGIIRKNPDIKYRHRAGSFNEFKVKQVVLLNRLSRLLKKGGILVYSVCSTEEEEGEEAVEEFLQKNDGCYIIEEGDKVNGIDFSEFRAKASRSSTKASQSNFSSSGFFRTYPHLHGLDGFFMARIKKL